jgi:CRP-like cAMP-binding protein
MFVQPTVQVTILIRERRNAVFNEEEKELYESLFNHFSSVQFKGMLRQATWVDAPVGEILTEQGKPLVRLVFIISGLASVDVDGTIVAYCKRHNFIGEISFVSGEPATATVRAMLPTRYLMWTQDDLHKLLKHDDSIRVAMQTVLTKNLVSKLITKSTDTQ